MSVHFLKADQLRIIIRQKGFSVKVLAAQAGLGVRTLERRFNAQFRTTPKAWIMRERMSLAPPLLGEGLSNKEIAASLSYTCESNFCRDFKRHFGCAPQKFARPKTSVPIASRFDKELSRFDRCVELPAARRIKDSCTMLAATAGIQTRLQSYKVRWEADSTSKSLNRAATSNFPVSQQSAFKNAGEQRTKEMRQT